jgi:hypothetical protein
MNQKGKILARIGVLLQLGLLISIGVTCVGMIRVFTAMVPGKPIDQNAVAASIGLAFCATSVGLALALVGAVFILLALFAAKFRAPWFYSNLWAVSVLWFFIVPVGMFLGILMAVYLSMHRHEFLERPQPAPPQE